MFIFFSNNKAAYGTLSRRAQLAPFFIALIVVVIITILVSVNISKIGLMKTYTANAVDSGALAGASQLSFTFNQLVLQAVGMYAAYQAYATAIGVMLDEAKSALDTASLLWNIAMTLMMSAAGVACIPFAIGKYIALALLVAAAALMLVSEFYFNYFYLITQSIAIAIDDMMEDQRSTYTDDMRDTLQDNFDSAEDMARDYAFLNSGISEALSDSYDTSGRERVSNPDPLLNQVDIDTVPSQADEFSFFIGDDATSSTFCWRDGQIATTPASAGGFSCQGTPDFSAVADTGNRLHLARVTVSSPGPPTTFQLIETEYNEDEFDDVFLRLSLAYTGIMVLIAAATAILLAQKSTFEGVPDCTGWHVYICFPFAGCYCLIPAYCAIAAAIITGVILVAAGQVVYSVMEAYLDEIRTGIQEANTFCDNDADVGNKIPITVTDVDHVYDQFIVDTYQEHQGQDLGLWTAKYPKVNSDARSSYFCDTTECGAPMPYPDCGVEGDPCGTICSHTISCLNGKDPCPAHEPELVGVDESL